MLARYSILFKDFNESNYILNIIFEKNEITILYLSIILCNYIIIMEHILSKSEILDIKIVNNYLNTALISGRKNRNVYINIFNIYQIYPDLIKDMLLNINNITYYKDYFYILQESTSETLNELIIDLIVTQLKQDIINMNNNKPISSLGKYLPADHSNINKATKCVPEIIKKLFNKKHDYRQYRKLKKRFNEYLGSVEPLLCTKQYDKIEFHKLNDQTIKKYRFIFMKKCPEIFTKFIYDKLSRFTLEELVTNANKYDANIVNQVFNNNFDIYKKNIRDTSECIIDLSSETFKNNRQNIVCATALLFDKISTLNGDEFVKTNNFINDMETLLQLCHGSVTHLDQSKILITSNVNYDHNIDNAIIYPEIKAIKHTKPLHITGIIMIHQLRQYIKTIILYIMIIVFINIVIYSQK